MMRTGASMCEVCNPRAEPKIPSDDGVTFAKIWWASADGDHPPQWKILRGRPDGNIEYEVTETPPPAEGHVDASDTIAWLTAVTLAGTADWAFLAKVWQPEHCTMIETLARALDRMAVSLSSAARIVVRMAGVPPVIASVVVGVVRQLAAHEDLLPVAVLARSLREVGTTACAGTASIASCRSARQLLGSRPQQPTDRVIEMLGVQPAIAVLTGIATTRQSIEQASPPAVGASRASVPRSARGLAAIRAVLPRQDPPATRVTFGQR